MNPRYWTLKVEWPLARIYLRLTICWCEKRFILNSFIFHTHRMKLYFGYLLITHKPMFQNEMFCKKIIKLEKSKWILQQFWQHWKVNNPVTSFIIMKWIASITTESIDYNKRNQIFFVIIFHILKTSIY